jgi:predicted kinase
VHLLCGLAAAGKTTYARRLEADLPAVRFTLDEWMLRLYGLRYDDPEYAARLDGCQALIWDTALQVLRLGHDVVLDWNQWNPDRRKRWRVRAEGAGYRVRLHHLDVPLDTAIARARDRDTDASHRLDEAAVRHSARILQPPSPAEGFDLVTVSS